MSREINNCGYLMETMRRWDDCVIEKSFICINFILSHHLEGDR